jgi:hypothetical protein
MGLMSFYQKPSGRTTLKDYTNHRQMITRDTQATSCDVFFRAIALG